jgi:hypothetical protein
VIGSMETPEGRVPQVSSFWTQADYLGTFKARWGIGRRHYMVDPGLYALGRPDEKSPVLVTANYKMSFDRLRRALPGRNAWILVLDTKGINVWCAAGKGTFGTAEDGRCPFSAWSSLDHCSFSVLRETPVPFSSHPFKKLKC